MSQKKIITRNREKPPLTYGPERLHYQYSAILPTLHLTLVSILQGVAFGVLLQGIPLPNVPYNQLFNFLHHIYFYLPYVFSSLLILLIWKQFVMAEVFMLWPLSTFQAGLIYLIALIEIITFRVIALPVGQIHTAISPTMISGWITGNGFIGVVGGIIRLNNLRLHKKEDYESKTVGDYSLKVEKAEGIIYVCIGSILITFGSLYVQLIQHNQKEAMVIPWITLISLMLILCIILLLDVFFRQSFLNKYVVNSDLIVSSHGVIRYEKEESEEKDPAQALNDNEENDEKDPAEELIQQIEILQTQVQALTKKIDVMQEQKQPPASKAAFKNSLVTQVAMAIGIPLVTWAIISRVKIFMKRGVRADH